MGKLFISICLILSYILITEGQSAMSEQKLGYRAFPKYISNPYKAKIISEGEFNKLDKIKMKEAASICDGHKKTIVWYSETALTYILEIQFNDKPTIYAFSICTFTPNAAIGMDRVDGEFAQDVEEYIISKELNFVFSRLNIFEGKDKVDIGEYFKKRGLFQK